MKIYGIIPPMTTPFDAEGAVRLDLVEGQIEWLIGQGAHGLAACGSTGEGHAIEAAEFRDIVAVTCEAARGRVPVIAGVIADSTRDAVKRARMVRDMKVAALQVTPVHYLFRPDDQSMLSHFRTVAEETGMPVIIYNVVPWSYLSPKLLVRIMSEVPGVIGVKQSAGDLKLLADLMITASPTNLIFSAVDALLYPSFALGAHGTIAAILSAAPRACVDLWDAVRANDHARALRLHERLLPLWNAMFADNLPACTKFAQSLQGCEAGLPRSPMPPATPDQQAAIRKALKGLGIELNRAA